MRKTNQENDQDQKANPNFEALIETDMIELFLIADKKIIRIQGQGNQNPVTGQNLVIDQNLLEQNTEPKEPIRVNLKKNTQLNNNYGSYWNIAVELSGCEGKKR